jgi:Helicase conserved C-terminal domain
MATGTTSAAVREHLVAALSADLIGPFDRGLQGVASHAGEETLPLAPSRWYLTGFLAPQAGRHSDHDPTRDDDLSGGDDEDDGSAEKEPESKTRAFWPASIGLSVFLPEKRATERLVATVSYADYVREQASEAEASEDSDTKPRRKRRKPTLWRRLPKGPTQIEVPLDAEKLAAGVPIPDSAGLVCKGLLKDAPEVGKGVRTLALFIVNERVPEEGQGEDERFAFQVELSIEFDQPLIGRNDRRGERSDDWDERVADLQFRDHAEFAVGHGIAAETIERNGKVVGARTTWLPRATARRVKTRELEDFVVAMDDLAAMTDATNVRAALSPLVTEYGKWLSGQQAIDTGSGKRRETRDKLIEWAERAKHRIADGIDLLATDPLALEAFRFANQAMAEAARKRSPERYADGAKPSWRLFQIAFVLLSLRGVFDKENAERETVELIFFPTGGGKTEAYLGLIAFSLVLRRLHGAQRPDGGAGVAVLLRYTLRLLTLDQLGRAATLICALELIRRTQPAHLGDVRFSLGLWVGKSATANTLAEVALKVREYRNDRGPSPFPLDACPWCGKPLDPSSMTLSPNATNPTQAIVGCTDYKCDFSPAKSREGLPVLFVDEQIYRELPSFIVATVDKFAMLPWRGETGALFGRVSSRSGRRFFGPMDDDSGDIALPDGLLPPDLIVQDELHLISGPLGTMVGLYESVIEGLSERRTADGKIVRPKIIASTATVRHATTQIQALYGRKDVAMFPPAGIDDSETFFGTVDTVGDGRDYIGVAAPGRAMKAIALRTYVTLMASAERSYRDAPEAADPYMTLVGYFNSLRELGGMRRLVEDEVRTRCLQAGSRSPEDFSGIHPWFADREVQIEPVELTSRESTSAIARAKGRLGLPHSEDRAVDVALASNMISVGVDIERLGLMVLCGQPKTTSEYIQASSRVGRDMKRPGLAVTTYNLRKPRDRSHFERFGAYHTRFYRYVEATSVTPFSGPALERGLAGVLVALARLSDVQLTGVESMALLASRRSTTADWVADTLAERVRRLPTRDVEDLRILADEVKKRCRAMFDDWEKVVQTTTEAAARRVYSRFDVGCRNRKALLFTVLDEEKPIPGSEDAPFAAATSMRDVEPSAHLWVQRKALSRKDVSGGN